MRQPRSERLPGVFEVERAVGGPFGDVRGRGAFERDDDERVLVGTEVADLVEGRGERAADGDEVADRDEVEAPDAAVRELRRTSANLEQASKGRGRTMSSSERRRNLQACSG